jgi:CRP-like cAMP-binding protein
MKLLHREEVEEAGYEMPFEGLCANIDEFNLEALKFAGEWVLADDETLVADGQQQNFLYLVISGEVGIYKRNDQGQSQFIASLGQGEAFGEMAFLSGGVASADVQASGEGILWRIDHERMLEFIGQGGPAGGQLCLNIASILSSRLVEGNRKVVDMGKELQASLHQLKQASQTGSTKDQALRQMQGKVKGMQDAFKGQSVKKSSFGWPAIAASIVAVLSLAGLTVSLVTGGGGEIAVGDSKLQEKVDELTENEEFYQGLKARLESQNETLKSEKAKLSKEREDLLTQVSESMGKDAELNQLKSQLADVERRLASASQSTGASSPTVVASTPTPSVRPAPTQADSPSDDGKAVAWALKNSTLVFPLHIQGRKLVTLQDRTQQVKIPVPSGSALKALRFHPSAPAVLIVSQPTSDKFLASVSIADTNFAEAVRPRYSAHERKVSGEANPLLSKPATPSFRPKPSSVAGVPSAPNRGVLVKISSPETPVVAGKLTPGITTGRPLQPQKPANILDSVASKPATRTDPRKPKSKAENDHGNACVCKDCRGKKAGKSSLFGDF